MTGLAMAWDNSTSDWYVVDTVRGVNKYILWNEQDAEDTSAWSDQNLTSTTLTLPSALATGTYLIECFYVGSYFQIKAFTGNASATAISFDSALSGEFFFDWLVFMAIELKYQSFEACPNAGLPTEFRRPQYKCQIELLHHLKYFSSHPYA